MLLISDVNLIYPRDLKTGDIYYNNKAMFLILKSFEYTENCFEITYMHQRGKVYKVYEEQKDQFLFGSFKLIRSQ
jgi:hypothetical protein